MYILSKELYFPPHEEADDEGILAIGGDLSVERLKLAYRKGIFPWYNSDEPIVWHSPDPRFVLFPDKLKVSKDLLKTIQSEVYQFTFKKSFEQVIHHCKTILRKGQRGTWIHDEIEQAFIKLAHEGIAISAEAWRNDDLVGGLYGVRVGRVFCGESMFSLEKNASKFAFVKLVEKLIADGVTLINCQIYTPYLESFGAEYIPREIFLQYLNEE